MGPESRKILMSGPWSVHQTENPADLFRLVEGDRRGLMKGRYSSNTYWILRL
jgi:hypothetical protein